MIFKKLKGKWEGLCRQCGVCCMRKKVIDQVCFIDFSSPCQYLDIETNKCFVYGKRFSYCSECRKITIFDAFFNQYLPEDCGYAVFFRFWKRRLKKRRIESGKQQT